MTMLRAFFVQDTTGYIRDNCDLDGSDEIAVHDTNEVAEAVWIPWDEVRVYDNGVSLTFEMIAGFKNGEI